MSAQLGQPGRILGIDYGSRRVGLSISDPLQILATAYGVIENSPNIWEALSEIARREEVALVVVGMPHNLKGQKGKKAQEVENFMGELELHIRLPVVEWDERFTTSIAEATRRTLGTKRSRRQARDGTIDAMAASVMLQGYLDSRKGRTCS